MSEHQLGDILTCNIELCNCNKLYVFVREREPGTYEAIEFPEGYLWSVEIRSFKKVGRLTDLEMLLWRKQLQF